MEHERKNVSFNELEAVAGGVSCAKTLTIINCQGSVPLRKSTSAESSVIGSANANVTYPFSGWSGDRANLKVGNFVGYVHGASVRVN